jgi:hypothetical protein
MTGKNYFDGLVVIPSITADCPGVSLGWMGRTNTTSIQKHSLKDFLNLLYKLDIEVLDE